MDRLRRVFGDDTPEQAYEPLEGGSERPDGEHIEDTAAQQFSWTDYSVFLLLGIAMLWAWYVSMRYYCI
jgi:equilibrative nucleoside transporter 1/2/3